MALSTIIASHYSGSHCSWTVSVVLTVEGDEEGWTVSVELDHFEQFAEDQEHEAEGRRLHVIIAGNGATPNEAAEAAQSRLTEVLSAVPEPWSARKPAN